MLFETLIKSFILYAAEVWGWNSFANLEAIQTRYLKWILKLEYATPNYITLEETKRKQLAIETGRRAMKFELEIRKGIKKNKILTEIIKEIDQQKCRNSLWLKERRRYLEKNGLSEEGLRKSVAEGKDVVAELSRTDYDNQLQLQYNQI